MMNQFGRLFQFSACQRFFSVFLDKTYIEPGHSLQGTLSGRYCGILLENGSADDWRCLSNLLRPSLLLEVNVE